MIVLAVLGLLQSPVTPGLQDLSQDMYATSGSWAILRNRASAECRLGTFFDTGTQLLIYFNSANLRADFSLHNPAWRSLKVGQKIDLKLEFYPGRRFGSGEATVVSSRIDDTVAISLGFANGVTMLSNFGRSKTFNVAANGVSLGTFPLTGSNKAVDLLIRCSVETAAQGAVGDPFEKPQVKE